MENTADSQRVRAGRRTYFFDLKKTRAGNNYLVITESRIDRITGGTSRSRLFVFPEDIQKFTEALQKIAGKIKLERKEHKEG